MAVNRLGLGMTCLPHVHEDSTYPKICLFDQKVNLIFQCQSIQLLQVHRQCTSGKRTASLLRAVSGTGSCASEWRGK
jgi:hypothetical protein